jgi:hypothetical protein
MGLLYLYLPLKVDGVYENKPFAYIGWLHTFYATLKYVASRLWWYGL